MKKIELLRSLGRLYLNDYYTIPRYKRINILQQGIAAMVTNKLDTLPQLIKKKLRPI
jgi:hypothetical protein